MKRKQREDSRGTPNKRRALVEDASWGGDTGEFMVGSVVRIRMKDFLTYDDCELEVGPRLNVVIGPNGTGLGLFLLFFVFCFFCFFCFFLFFCFLFFVFCFLFFVVFFIYWLVIFVIVFDVGSSSNSHNLSFLMILGKSTLVCAIAIGLGANLKVLGRAKRESDFIKHGNNQAGEKERGKKE